MRRVMSPGVVVCALVGVGLALGGTAASAAPTPGPSEEAEAPKANGTKVCTVTDPRARELSGIIATENGYIVVNDGTEIASRQRVFFLDDKCKVVKEVAYPTRPLDPEDLALSADGKTVWIADIGDNATNDERRPRVALWSMPLDGSTRPVIHRISYPDGTPHDAEALLMTADDVPIIITKTAGAAQLFVPEGPLQANNEQSVPMKKAGELTLPRTETENRLSAAGRITITGAARSADGRRVVLRTYADAFEWDVPDGDVVKALTTGKPRITPLADAFGEGISFTPDGSKYVTVSDVGILDEGASVDIMSYTPTKPVPAAQDAANDTADRSWTDSLSLQDITYLIGAVGVLGALLVGAGIFGIVRARRGAGNAGDPPPKKVGRQPVKGAVAPPADFRESRDERGRSGGPPDDRARSGTGTRGGSYGAAPSGGKPAGGVYGGRDSGGVYGGGSGGEGRTSSGGVYGGGPRDGGARGGGPRDGGTRGGGPRDGGSRDGGSRDGGSRDGRSGGGGVYGGGRGRDDDRGPWRDESAQAYGRGDDPRAGRARDDYRQGGYDPAPRGYHGPGRHDQGYDDRADVYGYRQD